MAAKDSAFYYLHWTSEELEETRKAVAEEDRQFAPWNILRRLALGEIDKPRALEMAKYREQSLAGLTNGELYKFLSNDPLTETEKKEAWAEQVRIDVDFKGIVKLRAELEAELNNAPVSTPETLGPQPKVQPQYIQKMIEQGRLYPDGKRVTKSLSDILDYLVTVIDPIPARFIHDTFKKPNGKPYAMKTIQGVLETINSGKTPGKIHLLSPQKKSV